MFRNEEVRRRAGIERKLASRAEQRVLRWLGHVERLDDYCMARRVLMAEVSGGRVRGRKKKEKKEKMFIQIKKYLILQCLHT